MGLADDVARVRNERLNEAEAEMVERGEVWAELNNVIGEFASLAPKYGVNPHGLFIKSWVVRLYSNPNLTCSTVKIPVDGYWKVVHTPKKGGGPTVVARAGLNHAHLCVLSRYEVDEIRDALVAKLAR